MGHQRYFVVSYVWSISSGENIKIWKYLYDSVMFAMFDIIANTAILQMHFE